MRKNCRIPYEDHYKPRDAWAFLEIMRKSIEEYEHAFGAIRTD